MLHDLLARYVAEVEATINKLEDIYVERYEEEVLSTDRLNLRIRVRFSKGYLLELNEAVFVESGRIRYLGYRYHFQDNQNKLIFRYDNTPHFPEVESFPHHIHSGDKVLPAEKPTIAMFIEEVLQIAGQ
jgi:hypothetical protein